MRFPGLGKETEFPSEGQRNDEIMISRGNSQIAPVSEIYYLSDKVHRTLEFYSRNFGFLEVVRHCPEMGFTFVDSEYL